jgi:hypothetical protein
MFTKTTKALIAALVLAGASITFVANAAVAQGWQGGNGYAGQYGVGHSNTARHNPADTNGF